MKKTRRVVQFGFLALVLVGVFGVRANCERWRPFGGVEALYTYAREGDMLCSLGVSNFFILGGVLLTTLLLRRAFCSYICPIGAISEWLSALGRKLRAPCIEVPPALDRAFSLFKYAVLAVILWLTWRAGELIFRGFDPCYALISRHGTDITYWAYVVSGAAALGSLAIVLPFCRWLCPLAAVLNPFSRFGLSRIKRDVQACLDCGLCAKSCPASIPVDQVQQVTAARCMSCMYRLPGYLRVEAWPGPETARVRVEYDPALTGEEAIKRAVTEPYYDVLADIWRMPPFRIEGYDLLWPRASLLQRLPSRKPLSSPAPATLTK
jgi:ferredoxin